VVIGDKHFTLHAGDILTLEGGVATDLSGLVWAVPTALPSQPSWLVDILSASYIGDAPLGAVLTSRLITESRTLRLAESVARLSVAGNGFGVTVRRNGAAVATITYQPRLWLVRLWRQQAERQSTCWPATLWTWLCPPAQPTVRPSVWC